MILGDFGTTWTKIYDTSTGQRQVIRTKEAGEIRAGLATGHNASQHSTRCINELIAMAQGGMRLIGSSFNVLDIGSRDLKYIRMEEGAIKDMNWNAQCGAMTGFTLELLASYYNLDFSSIPPADGSYPITCGLLGLERAFDDMAGGAETEEAIARFAKGLAINAHRFIGEPERFYLSGGMCENKLFLKSFPDGVKVIPMGRFLLLEGLIQEVENTDKLGDSLVT